MATLQRVAFMPDVPTIAESGLPGFEITAWYAVLAPAGTPKPMIDRLHREIVRIIDRPDVSDQLFVKGGLVRIASTPEQPIPTGRLEALPRDLQLRDPPQANSSRNDALRAPGGWP